MLYETFRVLGYKIHLRPVVQDEHSEEITGNTMNHIGNSLHIRIDDGFEVDTHGLYEHMMSDFRSGANRSNQKRVFHDSDIVWTTKPKHEEPQLVYVAVSIMITAFGLFVLIFLFLLLWGLGNFVMVSDDLKLTFNSMATNRRRRFCALLVPSSLTSQPGQSGGPRPLFPNDVEGSPAGRQADKASNGIDETENSSTIDMPSNNYTPWMTIPLTYMYTYWPPPDPENLGMITGRY